MTDERVENIDEVSTTRLAYAYGRACVALGRAEALHLASAAEAEVEVSRLWEELDTRLHTAVRAEAAAESELRARLLNELARELVGVDWWHVHDGERLRFDKVRRTILGPTWRGEDVSLLDAASTGVHAAVEEYRARVQAEMDAARAATDATVSRPVRYELVNAAGQPVSRDELPLNAVYATSHEVSLADDGTVVVRLRLEDPL